MNRPRAATVGQLLIDALGGRLGAPMAVLGYLVFAMLLFAYVATQVYATGLMEDITARKRAETLLQERIGLLTARYATATSKSRVSATCEQQLGLVEATSADIVRVVVQGSSSWSPPAGVHDVLGADAGRLSEVTRR